MRVQPGQIWLVRWNGVQLNLVQWLADACMCVCLQLDSHCHIISRFQPIPVVCWSSVGGSHEPACQHVRVVRGPKVKVSQVGSWDSVRCEQVRPADTCKQALDKLVSRRY